MANYRIILDMEVSEDVSIVDMVEHFEDYRNVYMNTGEFSNTRKLRSINIRCPDLKLNHSKRF